MTLKKDETVGEHLQNVIILSQSNSKKSSALVIDAGHSDLEFRSRQRCTSTSQWISLNQSTTSDLKKN